jgi:hypothetical protein
MARSRFSRTPVTAASLALALALAGCGGGPDDPFNFSDPFSGGPTGPDTRGVWVKPGADPDQRRAAVSECRTVASAQIDRDRKIDQDRQVGSETLGTAHARPDLNRRLRDRSQEHRRTRLFQDCMRDKGWQLR